MSLDDLAPVNTKRARDSAARSFMKFLEEEEVSWEYLKTCMLRENAPLILETVVDKFGMHLAFKEGCKGKLLARHSVMQYFRQAKNWLLDQFPQHHAAVDARLLKKGQTLERYCLKRESGGFVNKAPACTKKALKQMVMYLYSTASMAADYQDAALLCLLWFLFDRASDLTLLRKSNLSIGSGDIFFVRFIRIKTAEEQGLSLFPDDDFATCPILAIALALITQSSPTPALLSHLSDQQLLTSAKLTPSFPLIDLLDHPETMSLAQSAPDTSTAKAPMTTPGVHSYVNRVLDRIGKKAGVTERLTSHSFRRGGAQHANSAGLSAQWNFDRGAWNMTATNKAFAYVFNTPSEDHQVSKVLSSHGPAKTVSLLSLEMFDSHTQTKIRVFATALFYSCSGLQTSQYNMSTRVMETLTAYLILHYPSMKRVNCVGPTLERLELCVIECGYAIAELLAWSSHIACSSNAKEKDTTHQDTTTTITEHPMFQRQTALIEQLIKVNQRLDARPAIMEAKVDNATQDTQVTNKNGEDTSSDEPPAKRRRASEMTNLRDAWFSWYAQEPRMWSSKEKAIKHVRSNTKWIVGFLKLFLKDGFLLDTNSPRYRDDVLELGSIAEKERLKFLLEHNITARGSHNVLKHMRTLHKSGVLNECISHFRQLRSAGRITDPSPPHTHNIISSVLSV